VIYVYDNNNKDEYNKLAILSLYYLSQISYSLVVILELSGVLEVQHNEIMMSSINKNN